MAIKPTDMLIVCAHNEDEFNSLQASVKLATSFSPHLLLSFFLSDFDSVLLTTTQRGSLYVEHYSGCTEFCSILKFSLCHCSTVQCLDT